MTSVVRARPAQTQLDFAYSEVTQPNMSSASYVGPASSSALAPPYTSAVTPLLNTTPLASTGADELVGIGETPSDDTVRGVAAGPPPFLSSYTASTPSFDVAEFGLDLSAAGPSTDPDISAGFGGELKFPELPASLLDQAPEYEFSAHTRTNVFEAAQDYVGDEEANRLFGLDTYDPNVAFTTGADESLFLPTSGPLPGDPGLVGVGELHSYDEASSNVNEAQLAQTSRSLIDWGHSPSNRSTPSIITGGAITSISTPGLPTPLSGLSTQTPSRFLEAEPASKRRRQSHTGQMVGASDENSPAGYAPTQSYSQSPSQPFGAGDSSANNVTVPSHSLLPPTAPPATVWPPNPNVPSYPPQQHSPQQSTNSMGSRRVQGWQDPRYDAGPGRSPEWVHSQNGSGALLNGQPRALSHSGASSSMMGGSGYYGHNGYAGDRYMGNGGGMAMSMPAGGMGAGVGLSGPRHSLGAMPSRINFQDAYPPQSLQEKTEMIEAIGQAVDASLEADGIARCPYPNCTKTFAKNRTYNLKAHLRAHSQLKPYACSQCPRAFSRKHDLERHARVHSGDRPYVCEVCQKGFPRSDALRRHWRVEKECGDKAALLDSQQQQREREQEAHENAGGSRDGAASIEGRNGAGHGGDVRRGSTSASGGETSSEHSPAYLGQQATQHPYYQQRHPMGGDGGGVEGAYGSYPQQYPQHQSHPTFNSQQRQHPQQGRSPMHQHPQQQQQQQSWRPPAQQQHYPPPSNAHQQGRPAPDANGVIKYDQYEGGPPQQQVSGVNGSHDFQGSPPGAGGSKKRARED